MSNTQAPKTGLFTGKVKGAKVTDRGTYLNPGKYAVRVKGAQWKHCFGNYDAFILEFDIVTSSRPTNIERQANETAADYDARCKRAPNPVGSTATWFQSCKNAEVGFGALKGFAARVTGSNPEDPEFIEAVEPFLDEVVNGSMGENGERTDKGKLNGVLIPVEVIVIKTKPKPGFPEGGDFSKHNWESAIEEG